MVNSAAWRIGELCQGLAGRASGTMAPGEIARGLHLDEPARGARKFGRETLAAVERGGWRHRREHDLDAAVIELIDEHDEASRRIVHALEELGHVRQKERAEQPRDLDVVVLAARSL